MAYYSKGDKQKARENLEIATDNEMKYRGKDEAANILKSLNNA
jgi:hypothetical protein